MATQKVHVFAQLVADALVHIAGHANARAEVVVLLHDRRFVMARIVHAIAHAPAKRPIAELARHQLPLAEFLRIAIHPAALCVKRQENGDFEIEDLVDVAVGKDVLHHHEVERLAEHFQGVHAVVAVQEAPVHVLVGSDRVFAVDPAGGFRLRAHAARVARVEAPVALRGQEEIDGLGLAALEAGHALAVRAAAEMGAAAERRPGEGAEMVGGTGGGGGGRDGGSERPAGGMQQTGIASRVQQTGIAPIHRLGAIHATIQSIQSIHATIQSIQSTRRVRQRGGLRNGGHRRHARSARHVGHALARTGAVLERIGGVEAWERRGGRRSGMLRDSGQRAKQVRGAAAVDVEVGEQRGATVVAREGNGIDVLGGETGRRELGGSPGREVNLVAGVHGGEDVLVRRERGRQLGDFLHLRVGNSVVVGHRDGSGGRMERAGREERVVELREIRIRRRLLGEVLVAALVFGQREIARQILENALQNVEFGFVHKFDDKTVAVGSHEKRT